MNELIFCIPCKYVENKSRVFDCVSNIRSFHPDADVLVIDSYSINDSYLKKLHEDYGTLYDDNKNSHYIDGVIWHAFKKYPRKKYCFIHDNVIIGRDILDDVKTELSVYSYFNSCFKPFDKIEGDHGLIGLEDNVDSLNWVYDNLKRCNIIAPNLFSGVLGCMFNIDRDLLEKIYNLGWIFSPDNKKQAEQMERVWGIIFNLLGFDIRKNCIIGYYLDTKINCNRIMSNNKITKYFDHRE